MERSGNFYKAIRLGYILISILIGCMAYNSLYEWQEIEALELGNKKIDELRKEIPVGSWQWTIPSRVWRGLGFLRIWLLRVAYRLFLRPVK